MMDPRLSTRINAQSAHAAQFIGFFNTFPDLAGVQQPELLAKFEKVVEWAKQRAEDEWDDDAGLELAESLGPFPWAGREGEKEDVVMMQDVGVEQEKQPGEEEEEEEEEDELALAVPATTATKKAPKKTAPKETSPRSRNTHGRFLRNPEAASKKSKTPPKTAHKHRQDQPPAETVLTASAKSGKAKKVAAKAAEKPQDHPSAPPRKKQRTTPMSSSYGSATRKHPTPAAVPKAPTSTTTATTTGPTRKPPLRKAPAALKPAPSTAISKTKQPASKPSTTSKATTTSKSISKPTAASKPPTNPKKTAAKPKPAPKPKKKFTPAAKVKNGFPSTCYQTVKYTPGEVVLFHCHFAAIRRWMKEKWVRKGSKKVGGHWEVERELDLEQLLLACAKVEMSGKGIGKEGEGLRGKVFLERNLRRGRKWVKAIGVEGVGVGVGVREE